MSTPLSTPHEPEIERLGRIVRVALLVLRGISVLGGLGMIASAIYTVIDPVPIYSGENEIPPRSTVMAHQMTWLCVGLPLALPVACTIGRGWRIAIVVGVAAWFGPMLLEGDHDYGYILRMVASLIGVAIITVWRTLFALTKPGA